MKVISVDQPAQAVLAEGLMANLAPIGPADITVTVEHNDGTQGVYKVRTKNDLVAQVQAYMRWQSDFAAIQAMVGQDIDL